MNYSTLIVKIITKPTQSFFKNGICLTEFIGKFYQYRNNKYSICKVSIWGPLSYDLDKYYKVKDYAIVEGYLSHRESNFEKLKVQAKIEMSAFRSYPIILNPIQIKK